MTTWNWNITISDTETIAVERALWLLLQRDFPGKDAGLEAAAQSVLDKLQRTPVRASGAIAAQENQN